MTSITQSPMLKKRTTIKYGIADADAAGLNDKPSLELEWHNMEWRMDVISRVSSEHTYC